MYILLKIDDIGQNPESAIRINIISHLLLG